MQSTNNHSAKQGAPTGLLLTLLSCLSLLFVFTGCSESSGDISKAPHQYELAVSGLV